MTPTNFPEANSKFTPPAGLDESQCKTIYAWQGVVKGGSVDGSPLIVTAWLPNEQERQDIAAGKPVFFSSIGGLPPHFLTTSFEQASKPA